jgi:hypothetical protein
MKIHSIVGLVISLIIFLPFQIWWMGLDGFIHWQGFIAFIGAVGTGWYAAETWNRYHV